MTSIPASRSARAMIFAPRSCPSSPGFATTTRILRPPPEARACVWGLPSKRRGSLLLLACLGRRGCVLSLQAVGLRRLELLERQHTTPPHQPRWGRDWLLAASFCV